MIRAFDRRLLVMLCLGFASGLPLHLSGMTLRQWMTEGHVSLGTIGLTAGIGIAYSLKFLWSPLLDQPPPIRPLIRAGRRRGWLLLIQPGLIAATIALAFTDPVHAISLPLMVGGMVAFLSASQDIAIDAWRIETFPTPQQGYALGLYIWGYRLAMLASGAGAIALAGTLGWRGSLLLMAALGLVGLAATLAAPEPDLPARPNSPGRWIDGLRHAYLPPLREFLARRGAAAVIAYVALFKLGEALAGVMLPSFYHALGFNRAAVALALGPASLVASIAGYAAGGVVMARLGLGRALIATGILQMLAMGMYVVLALSAGNHAILYGTALLENFVEALADIAFLSFLSSLCSLRFTATQYALLSSIAPLALRTLGGSAGFLAGALGWPGFYAVAAAASLPALAIMLLILRRHPAILAGTQAAEAGDQ